MSVLALLDTIRVILWVNKEHVRTLNPDIGCNSEGMAVRNRRRPI